MNSGKNFALVVLTLAALGGAVLTWKQHLELEGLRLAAANASSQDEFKRRALAAEKRAQSLEDALASAQDKLNEARATAAKVEAPKRAGDNAELGSNIRTMVSSAANMMNQPEMQRMMAMGQKAALDTNYAKLFKQLNLAPEKLEQFKKLMVERQSVGTDVFTAAVQQGLDPMQNRREIARLTDDAQGKVDGEIKSLLGDSDFSSYQNYQTTLPQRNVVNQLQQSLSYTQNPLSDSQADQLVQILAQNPPARAAGAQVVTDGQNVMVKRVAVSSSASGGGADFVTATVGPSMGIGFGTPPISDAAVSASRAVLTEPQVEALQQVQQQQAQMRSTIQAIGGGSGQGGGAIIQFSTSTSGSPPPPSGDKPPGGG